MERSFGGELGGTGSLEQVELGVMIEYFEPYREDLREDQNENKQDSDLLFGRVDMPPLYETTDGTQLLGAAEQLRSLGIIQDTSAAPELLPPACGVSAIDVEYLLDAEGCAFESLKGASLEDLTEALAQERRVLCKIPVSHMGDAQASSELEAFCLTEVMGIDLRDPQVASVCLESFGGAHVRLNDSLGSFMKAWAQGGNSCYVIYRE